MTARNLYIFKKEEAKADMRNSNCQFISFGIWIMSVITLGLLGIFCGSEIALYTTGATGMSLILGIFAIQLINQGAMKRMCRKHEVSYTMISLGMDIRIDIDSITGWDELTTEEFYELVGFFSK